MTRSEYLSFQNKRQKHHESDAYQTTVAELNKVPLVEIGSTERDRRDRSYIVAQPDGEDDVLVFRDKDIGKVAAVLERGVLTKGRFAAIPSYYIDWRTRQPVMLKVDEVREEKYPDRRLLPLVFDLPKLNRERYPVILQRFAIGGRGWFELRAERKPRRDKRDTIVILHDGLVVAMGSDEWGATLIRVAEEFRRVGLGDFLKKEWTKYNPDARSGGFTAAGERMAIRFWAQRVRDFSANGWYSELVRRGLLTMDRVREIVSGASGRASAERLPSDAVAEEEPTEDPLLFLEDGSFILYDRRFLSEPDEKYVLGYGFLRDAGVGTFFFRLEYEEDYADLVTATALQMARDLGEKIYVADIPGDVVEWRRVPEAVERDGYVSLKGDILDLKALSREETKVRRAADRFDEKRYALMELADSKWRT